MTQISKVGVQNRLVDLVRPTQNTASVIPKQDGNQTPPSGCRTDVVSCQSTSTGISSSNLRGQVSRCRDEEESAGNTGANTLWTDDQTAALLRTAVDGLDDIDQLLFVLQDPVELVVVACPEIAHLG